MANKILYQSTTGIAKPHSITVSQNHDSAIAIASVQCESTSLIIGDAITIDIGYSTAHNKVFGGYVKRIDTSHPDGLITITANDRLVRASDYFIVAANQESPYTFNNISGEDLIAAVLTMAGLSNYDFDNTMFTFGINNPVEINLTGAYDYCRMICDLIAWSFWCDKEGVIYLRNRKPYPMDGASGQPGDTADVPLAGKELNDENILAITTGLNERDLRNKIVVYGKDTIMAFALSSTSLNPETNTMQQVLPSGFYKAAVLASPLIETQGFAQNAADYNLRMLNKMTSELIVTAEGDSELEARKVISVDSTLAGKSGNWYIYQLDHTWRNTGFTTELMLRK